MTIILTERIASAIDVDIVNYEEVPLIVGLTFTADMYWSVYKDGRHVSDYPVTRLDLAVKKDNEVVYPVIPDGRNMPNGSVDMIKAVRKATSGGLKESLQALKDSRWNVNEACKLIRKGY